MGFIQPELRASVVLNSTWHLTSVDCTSHLATVYIPASPQRSDRFMWTQRTLPVWDTALGEGETVNLLISTVLVRPFRKTGRNTNRNTLKVFLSRSKRLEKRQCHESWQESGRRLESLIHCPEYSIETSRFTLILCAQKAARSVAWTNIWPSCAIAEGRKGKITPY